MPFGILKVLDHYDIDYFIRATGPVVISDKEEEHIILPTALNFVVRRGKLRNYTLQKPQRYSESLRLLEAIRNVL